LFEFVLFLLQHKGANKYSHHSLNWFKIDWIDIELD